MTNSPDTINEETLNIQDIISRYRNWLTAGVFTSGYWKDWEHFKTEIEAKVNELEKKLKLTK